MDWFRWYAGTVTDPKWRVVSRRSGQPLHVVLAVWAAVLENANQAEHRGTLESFDPEDVGAALDLEGSQVQAVLDAMQGKVLDGESLSGWEGRQPKREREDSSTERVRRFREKKKQERHVTPCNALEEKRGEPPLSIVSPPPGQRAADAAESDPGFEMAWAAYPSRAGDNPKRRALKAWRARLAAGVPVPDLVAGVQRYARYIRSQGKEGTEFVMQAATFFGPDERWGEAYALNGAAANGNGGTEFHTPRRIVHD